MFYFLIAFFLVLSPAFADEESGVEVISVSGSVEILSQGESEYKKAEEGMFLNAGDSIKTGQDSYIELAFDENQDNVVRLNADTSAVLILKEDEKIEVLEGEVFSSISSLPSGSTFEIRTPTAVVGVRGTEWITRVGKDDTVVEALKDNPYVSGIERDGRLMSEKKIVLAGHMTTVKRFQHPMPLVKLPKDVYQRGDYFRRQVRMHIQEARIRRKLNPPRLRKLNTPVAPFKNHSVGFKEKSFDNNNKGQKDQHRDDNNKNKPVIHRNKIHESLKTLHNN